MDKQSKFDEVVAIFEKTRPAIERGIGSMQSHGQQKTKQIWQEMVIMIESGEQDIEKFADKLQEFNKQVYEYQTRCRMLSPNANMHVI